MAETAFRRRGLPPLTGDPEALLAALPVGVLVVDAQERVLFANATAERLLGVPAASLAGAPSPLPLPDAPGGLVEQIDAGRASCWLDLRVSEIQWDGQRARVVCIQDETELLAAREAEADAERFATARDTAARVAREYRDLLTGLLGASQLLQDRPGDAHQTEALTRQLVEQAREGVALARQLLTVGGQRMTTRQGSLDGIALLSGYEDRLLPLMGPGVKLHLSPSTVTGRVPVGREQLDSILTPLVQNATEALPEGGMVQVGARDFDAQDHEHLEDGPYAVLWVKDNGVGIDAPTRRRVFEPFFSTKEAAGHSGLGLAQVHGGVQQAGGWILMRSEADLGTLVEVFLPREITGTHRQARTEDVSGARGSLLGAALSGALAGRTILLAEDEPGIRQLLGDLLTAVGAQVRAVPNAGQALQAVSDATVDLLITDVRMPGPKVRDVVDALRARSPQARVIAMSGFPQDETDIHDLLADGQVVFLQKPFHPTALLEAASRLVADADA